MWRTVSAESARIVKKSVKSYGNFFEKRWGCKNIEMQGKAFISIVDIDINIHIIAIMIVIERGVEETSQHTSLEEVCWLVSVDFSSKTLPKFFLLRLWKISLPRTKKTCFLKKRRKLMSENLVRLLTILGLS